MNDRWTSWPAPAKLNLFLHIVGRRDDGYHELQTLFQLLDWGDVVRLRVRTDAAVIRRSEDVPGVPIETDLTLRAAQSLQRRSGRRLGVDIGLDKRLPIGGGLGGGSSDAATTLVALNELWRTGLSVDQLADIALDLGADVPVFVHGHSAWGEGVGERLTPIELPQRHYVIIDPRVSVATAPLFQAHELTRNSPRLTIFDYLAGTKTANVFAPLVRARYPHIGAALDWLGEYGDARLSGSGACVFVALNSAHEAALLVASCPPMFAAYHAVGLARSPLLDAVATYRSAAA